ncbi:class I SAM-dependent methyltransferase [Methylophilus aquaticus]|uniref:Methyltransferase domain-containing protein n=1 Tax=Methylophilus aquaticus TaxID=1971610 RepID=A0ABT9JRD2_9PROT|nr:methyltransferase domain-containing protein [Methylophilus aquaticus]MDP8567133.1 methyltransferase domain-containing protein [Methylophilus aquaticus]
MQTNSLASFDSTALGQYIAQRELDVYGQSVADVFGYHALQLGWPGYDLLGQSRIPYKHYLQPTQHGKRTSLICESEFLPFSENTIDLICLPHVLEQCLQPQQTLRELLRVLVPEGTLVLTGVSPVSLLGLRARGGQFRLAGQFQRLFTAWRIRDWLSVLGFEVVNSSYLMHALPVNDNRWLARQSWLEKWGPRSCGMTGGIYFVVAKKRIFNVRVIRPDWKKAPLSQALHVRKTRSRIQKQLKCADDDTSMDRNIR